MTIDCRSLIAGAAGRSPGERPRAPRDCDKPLQTTSAEEAFRPPAEGGCPPIRA